MKEKTKTNIKKHLNGMLMLTLIFGLFFALIDVASTLYALSTFEGVYEMNPWVSYLIDNIGLISGLTIAMIVYIIFYFSIARIGIEVKTIPLKLFSSLVLLLMYAMNIFAVTSNINLIIFLINAGALR